MLVKHSRAVTDPKLTLNPSVRRINPEYIWEAIPHTLAVRHHLVLPSLQTRRADLPIRHAWTPRSQYARPQARLPIVLVQGLRERLHCDARATLALRRWLELRHAAELVHVLADESALALGTDRELGRGKCLMSPVRAHEALHEIDAKERTAVEEHNGKDVRRADEACEVYGADGMLLAEHRAGEVRGEIFRVRLAEEGQRFVDDVVDLVLVAEADAGGKRVEGGLSARVEPGDEK